MCFCRATAKELRDFSQMMPHSNNISMDSPVHKATLSTVWLCFRLFPSLQSHWIYWYMLSIIHMSVIKLNASQWEWKAGDALRSQADYSVCVGERERESDGLGEVCSCSVWSACGLTDGLCAEHMAQEGRLRCLLVPLWAWRWGWCSVRIGPGLGTVENVR